MPTSRSWRSAPGQEHVRNLRTEVDQFHRTSLAVIAETGAASNAVIRDLLNRRIIPRREAAVKISEDIQSLNRLAFVRQQADIATSTGLAEAQSWRRLGLALATSLAVLLVVAAYSGRLEGRLREQMERDSRMSRELHDATVKLIGAQEDERRVIARELHDEVGQVLTALQVELSLAQRSLDGEWPADSAVDRGAGPGRWRAGERARPLPVAPTGGPRRPRPAGGDRCVAARAGAASRDPGRVARRSAWTIAWPRKPRLPPTASSRRR